MFFLFADNKIQFVVEKRCHILIKLNIVNNMTIVTYCGQVTAKVLQSFIKIGSGSGLWPDGTKSWPGYALVKFVSKYNDF